MSHLESIEFFRVVAAHNEHVIEGASVLEVGSFDVNGGIRNVFANADRYIGVDLCEGPGVDIVSAGNELDYADGFFDVTLSSECFEHNPFWRETFANMVRMTRPGGLVIISCASRGRIEHGTSRTVPAHSPGTQSRGMDYYMNLNESDFSGLGLDEAFTSYKFWYLSSHFDLFFVGIKKGGSDPYAQVPPDDDVFEIGNLMTVTHKFVTVPFRALSHVVSEPRYQSVALPLSRALRPLIMFEEYRRNTPEFRWSDVGRAVGRRLRLRS